MSTKAHVDEWPDLNCHATTQISVCYKEAEKRAWSWKEWQDYFPVFSTCETIAGILHPVLGFPNTWKTLAGSSAEGQQDIYKGSSKVPSNLNWPIILWTTAVEEVEAREYRFFEPGLLLKLLWKHGPRFSRAGECYLTYAVIDYKTFHSLLQEKLSCCQLWGLYRERWDKRREDRIALLEGLKNQRPCMSNMNKQVGDSSCKAIALN